MLRIKYTDYIIEQMTGISIHLFTFHVPRNQKHVVVAVLYFSLFESSEKSFFFKKKMMLDAS